MTSALCMYDGQLVLMEVTKSPVGSGGGSCPECGGKDFTEKAGWVRCPCGFAVSRDSYDKVMAQRKIRVRK